jgi:hypothetical protein
MTATQTDVKPEWVPTLRRIVQMGLHASPNMTHAGALDRRGLTQYHQGGGWTATPAGVDYLDALDRAECS